MLNDEFIKKKTMSKLEKHRKQIKRKKVTF